MPIDINLLRVDAGGDPEKVKKSERDRFRDDSIVDQIIEIDNKWRKCKFNSHLPLLCAEYLLLLLPLYSRG